MLQKNILILAGLVFLAYVTIFLLAPKDITDYTIADTEYWRETGHKLYLKTAYEYNNKDYINSFPKVLGDWNGMDFKYDEWTYKELNADILLSRAYTRPNGDLLYLNIINSKTGESFHGQQNCVISSGWNIDNDSVAEFKIADPPNPFTKLYTNRLDISKEGEKQILIYWFMVKKFGAKDDVTMIRISSTVDNNGTDATFNTLKDFLENQLFGAMYKDTKKEKLTNAEYLSKEYGNNGLLVMIFGLLIPIGIMVAGIRKKE